MSITRPLPTSLKGTLIRQQHKPCQCTIVTNIPDGYNVNDVVIFAQNERSSNQNIWVGAISQNLGQVGGSYDWAVKMFCIYKNPALKIDYDDTQSAGNESVSVTIVSPDGTNEVSSGPNGLTIAIAS